MQYHESMHEGTPKPPMRFVLPPSMRAIAWLSVVFYGPMSAAGAVSAATSSVAEDRFAGLLCLIGFGGFFVLSVYFLVSCRRHVLVFEVKEIVDRGLFDSKCMELSRIASAEWRPIRSRCHSVVLRDGAQRMVIQVRLYGSWNHSRLVRAVRDVIPMTASQTGWNDNFIKPFPPPNEAHSPKRLFRFTCVASAIGWMAFMAIWVWLSTMEADLPSLPSLALKSVVACGVFPAAVALFWWLDTLDKRAEERQLSSSAPNVRAGGPATR